MTSLAWLRRADAALQRRINALIRPSAPKLWALLAVATAFVASLWWSGGYLWAVEEPSTALIELVMGIAVPKSVLKGIVTAFATPLRRGSANVDDLYKLAALRLSSTLTPSPVVRSICVWGSWGSNVVASAAMAASLVTWNVLAIGVVVVFSILATVFETVLAIAWAEYLLSGLLVVRAWVLNFALVAAMVFAFELTAPPATLDTRLAGQRGTVESLTLQVMRLVGVDPLLGARIAAAAAARRKKRG